MRELWEHLQHVLLLGTGRTTLSEKAKHQLRQLGLQFSQRSEALHLLTSLSLLHYLRKGASQLPKLDHQLSKAPKETNSLPSPKLCRLVERMLSEEDLQPILSEYIELSAVHNLLLPPESLPYLFKTHRNHQEQRQLIRQVMGQRGEWLARQNTAWIMFSQQFKTEAWYYGSPEERLAYFTALRREDPEKSRDLLEADWDREARSIQLPFLSCFRHGISIEDVPFLSSCLKQPDQTINTLSAQLLMQLPESDFYQKVKEVFHQLFIFKSNAFQVNKQFLSAHLLPSISFIADLNGKSFSVRERDKLVRFFVRIVPPGFWEALSKQVSGKAFQAFQSSSFYAKYRIELAEAIHLHQDIHWMQHFLPAQYELDKNHWEGTAIERLAKKLPYVVFAHLTERLVQFHNGLIEGHSLMYTILLGNKHFWPNHLSLKVVKVFQDYLRYSKSFLGGDEASHYEALLYRLALKSETSLLISLQAGWPQDSFNWYRWESTVKRMLKVLNFRAKMQEAFRSSDNKG